MTKKNKKEYIDDGHTIYNMDVEGFKWHDKKVKDKKNIVLSKRERLMLILSAYKSYLPKLFIIIFAFSLVIVLLYFWLK